MGLDVKKLRIPPDAYYPGLITELFITPLLRSFLTPEVRAATEAVMAYLEGDEEPIRALVDKWLVKERPAKGKAKPPRRSNAFHKTKLERDYLVHGEQLPIPLVVGFLKVWEERLGQRARAGRIEELSKELERSIKKSPNRDYMQALRGYEEPEKRMLSRVLPGAVVDVGEDKPLEKLRPETQKLIKSDSRLLYQTRAPQELKDGTEQGRIVPLDAPGKEHEDELDLEDFARIEKERRRDNLGELLSPTELELVHFWRGGYAREEGESTTPQQRAMAEFGMARATVDAHVRNIKRKLGA